MFFQPDTKTNLHKKILARLAQKPQNEQETELEALKGKDVLRITYSYELDQDDKNQSKPQTIQPLFSWPTIGSSGNEKDQSKPVKQRSRFVFKQLPSENSQIVIFNYLLLEELILMQRLSHSFYELFQSGSVPNLIAFSSQWNRKFTIAKFKALLERPNAKNAVTAIDMKNLEFMSNFVY